MACGLANVGQTCYLNTLLQCLKACPEFRASIVSSSAGAGAVANGICELFAAMDGVDGGSINPSKFIKTVAAAFTFLNIRSQNDIHEIYMLLVSRLGEELKTEMPRELHTSKRPVLADVQLEQAFVQLTKKCDSAWRKAVSHEYSSLTDALHGQVLAQIVCGNCKYIHHNYQPFSVWEVPLVADAKSTTMPTLETCFNSSMSAETIDDWKCSKCNATAPSKKTLRMWKLPRVLVICIKRFRQENGRLIKINAPVDVPLEAQMFPMEMGPDNAGLCYRLRAAAVHSGDIHFGHYNAICAGPDAASWLAFNDAHIFRVVDVKEAVKDGYLLFYAL